MYPPGQNSKRGSMSTYGGCGPSTSSCGRLARSAPLIAALLELSAPNLGYHCTGFAAAVRVWVKALGGFALRRRAGGGFPMPTGRRREEGRHFAHFAGFYTVHKKAATIKQGATVAAVLENKDRERL